MLTALNFTDKDKKLTPKESMSIYRESLRIMDAKDAIEFDIDTLKIIQDNVVQIYGPLISGQVASIIEG